MNMHSKEQEILSMMRVSVTKDKGFTLLMETYKERIYWHIRRLVVSHEDAEDILQETFINVYRYAGTFNRKSRLYTWLYRIATNECIRWSKKDKGKHTHSQNLVGKHSDEPAEDDMESRDSILNKFQKCILMLPEKQRIVFNLRYYDELSYEDISEITSTSVNSLKSNYHYACEKIKEMLRNQIIELREKFYHEFRKVLSPSEIMKFHRIEAEVSRRMMQHLRQRGIRGMPE